MCLTEIVLATNRPTMRYLLGALVAGLALTSAVAEAASTSTTWAVFDSRRAMEATTHFTAAKNAMEKELKERQQKLDDEKAALTTRREELEAKKAVVANSASMRGQEQALLKDEQQLAQQFMLARRELVLFEQKLREQLFARLEVAVRVVAVAQDNTFVVDAGRVLFHKKTIDITDEVVKVYNERFGDKPLDLKTIEVSQVAPKQK
ncbi:MAG: OmpH family outer membrane protein [Myxococcales bacterium]|nr:OmpH family outer membrane protein [Myxococcales bacterium]